MTENATHSSSRISHPGPFCQPREDGVTLAICTYNGQARLEPTLAHIVAQKRSETAFEVLVIDNASTDGTADAARRLWPKELSEQLRVVHEPLPGVANARARAIREARYEVLSFVDDDNWVSSNWVAAVHRVFREHPLVAILHCHSSANLPGPEPDDFPIYSGWLAVGSLVKEEGIVTRRPISFWTAGLSLRLSALSFLDEPGFRFALTGRTMGQTLGGEDHEICLCVLLGGWDAYFTRCIEFVHDIPESRLQRKYIERLVENGGRSRRLLNEYRSQFSSKDYPTGFPLLLSYLSEVAQRGAAYWFKLVTGRLEPGISPSRLSFRISRGKVVGFFATRSRVPIARRNIELARAHGPLAARKRTRL